MRTNSEQKEGHVYLIQAVGTTRYSPVKYLDTFEVFPDGSIWRYGRQLKGAVTINGYRQHKLKVKGVQNLRSTHRVIAECFIPNPENKPQVNHINGIKLDNRVENLEWVTASENHKHAFAIGLQVARKGSQSNATRLIEDDIKLIFGMKGFGYNQYQIADAFDVSEGVIGKILRKESWKHCHSEQVS